MKNIKLILSGEFFFAAFLLAGYFKGGIPWFPVDVTIFCLFITIIFSLGKLYKNPSFSKQSLVSIALFSILTIIILISYLMTSSVFYADEKLIRFIAITSWSFLGVFIIVNSSKSLRDFLESLVLISFLVSLVGFINVLSNLAAGTYAGTIFVMNTDYLALGRTVGLGLVIWVALTWFDTKKTSVFSIVVSIVMFSVIVFSGGRMPLFATIFSLVVIMFLSANIYKNRKISINLGTLKLALLGVISLTLLIPLYLKGFFDSVSWRVSSIFTGVDQSSLVRIDLYETAFKMIYDSPLIGTGWASFPLYYYGMDIKVYPHNIFLEVFSELGLFALIVFVAMIFYAVYIGVLAYKSKFKKLNSLQLALIAGFTFFLLNANTSGDLTDNKILLTFVALLTISLTINKPEMFTMEQDKVSIKKEKRKFRKVVW